MANQEHVEVVKRGAAAIAEWRQGNRGVVLELIEAGLSKADLSGADLREAHLGRADLFGANLNEANLGKVDLFLADLIIANLSATDLSGANLSGANLSGANLSGANLSGADLTGANLSRVNLGGADLGGADLNGANFSGANLRNANLSDARLFGTTFARCDLSLISGIETVQHEGPSSIGTDTLLLTYEGAGNRLTPEFRDFFIKAGVPPSLVSALPRIAGQVRYHTAFVAYGEPDRAFAEQLYGDLLSKGVNCWMFTKDYIPGKRTWHEIGQRRREAGKFIVLCSVAGLDKPGPKKEIKDQKDDDEDKIIPISLDDLWRADSFEVWSGGQDLKPFLVERNWADFSREAEYDNALAKLLRGLELRPDAPAP